jgi:hypothetical protein
MVVVCWTGCEGSLCHQVAPELGEEFHTELAMHQIEVTKLNLTGLQSYSSNYGKYRGPEGMRSLQLNGI